MNNRNLWAIILIIIIVGALMWIFSIDRGPELSDDPNENLGEDDLEDIDSQIEELEILDPDDEFEGMDKDLDSLEE